MAGASFALFTGMASENATLENVTLDGGELLIDAKCHFEYDDYTIGLLCGIGEANVKVVEEITYDATEDSRELVDIIPDGEDKLIIEIITE